MSASINRRISERQNELKTPDSKKSSSRDAVCRTCLGTQDLEAIFKGKINHEKRSHELKLVTGLQIKKNDGLSQKMCFKCMELMTRALQFRKTSKKTEKALMKLCSGTKLKKKSKLHKIIQKEDNIAKPEIDVSFEDIKEDDDVYEDCYANDCYENDYNDCDDVLEANITMEKQPSTTRKRIRTPNATSYKCTTCSKDFKMKATYKAHMRFHTHYCVCEACGKRCRNNNQLQEHKRARHGLGRIHKCAYCEYSSATKEALTIHERRHTGERPYICDHCGATFHRRSNLVQHIAIHLPEKNFQCNLCNKLEKSHKRLQIHIYNNHRARQLYRFLCPMCPKTYQKMYHVRRHLTRGHGVSREMQGHIERCSSEGLDVNCK